MYRTFCVKVKMSVTLTSDEKMICHAIRTAVKSSVPKRTIGDVAENIGTTYDVLSSIINGRTKPRTEIIDGIRRELNLPASWPFESHTPGVKVSSTGVVYVRVKIIGLAAAGEGESNTDYDPDDYRVPERLGNITDFAFIVSGDSMLPALQPGDVACFKKSSTPKRGYPFLVKDKNDGYRIKIIGYKNGSWTLESFNPAYEPEAMPAETQLQGYLVGWSRVRGTQELNGSDTAGLRFERSDFFLD